MRSDTDVRPNRDSREHGSDISRRTALAVTVGGILGLAGCQTLAPASDPSAADTATERATGAQVTDSEPTVVEFDGGGAADFADALSTVTAEAGSTLRIVDGPHRLDASRAPDTGDEDIRTHFMLDGAEDVVIEGNDQSLVFEDPTRGALFVRDSDGVSIRNLDIDYDPLPFTQGTVTTWDAEARELVVELQSEYPSLTASVFDMATLIQATVHDESGDRLTRVNGRGGAFKRFADIARISSRRFRLALADGIGTAGLAAGRTLVIAARSPAARALRFHRATDAVVDDVTVRASGGYAVYCNYCAGPVVRNVNIAPPDDGDRLISSCSDGIHLDNCRESPLVADCHVDRVEDDGIVVDTQLMTVTEFVDSRTVRVSPSVGALVAAGDTMAAASSEFERRGDLPSVDTVDMQGGGLVDGPALPEAIHFSDTVDDTLAVGDYLTSRAFENRGFSVRNNEVRDTNARLVRVGGGADGVVESNLLEDNNNDGILVEANGGGTPKRWVDDVTIRDNTLRDVGLVGVASGRPEGIVVDVDGEPVYDRDSPAPAGRPHRNVEITNNTLVETATTGIHLADTEGATVADNETTDPGRIEMTDLDRYGVGVDHAYDVAVTGNRVVGESDDVTGFGWRIDSDDIRPSDNELVVAGVQQTAQIQNLDDG